MTQEPRLFFAIWPNQDERDNLAHLQNIARPYINGTFLNFKTFHLTLIFLGKTPLALVPGLSKAAASIKPPSFELRFNSSQIWPQHNLFHTVPQPPCEELNQFQMELHHALSNAGIHIEHRIFFPHVSLIRNASGSPPKISFHFSWKVSSFILAESLPSQTGPHYNILEEFPAVQ
ncbi:MAG: RNA 2',3'-cyclic phosphodiesterase [Proteobacteria bacterium]|nr:RNA 2',3'-cyclic phosphodiesterase [Pseudomonadota bacterium]MDE3208590.1 RNA 2',3'-cyclic phosphodiesterase [Pseudomonadota bacterium]